MNKEQKQFLLSSLFSGIMIGIGCTVYLSCVNKLVGALLFCAGLFFILTNGGTLFTGICGLKTPVKKLAWVFVLNGLGTVIPAIVSWSNVVDGATKLGATAAVVMLGKLSMNPVSWLLNGLMCGVLMYHTTRYVNENLHRYTPKRELEAELRRKQARGGQKEGKT